jgi:hypothetical protein
MASEIDICNLALGQLGSHSIVSFADGTVEADACTLNYRLARDAVLESRDWSFAIYEVPLVKISSPSPALPPEYGQAYAFPDQCLLLRYCFIPSPTSYPGGQLLYMDATSEQLVTRPSFNVMNGYIMCSTDTLYARYIKRIEDPSKFTTNFIQALATRLAFELAMPLTNKVELQAQKWKEYEAKITEASGRDGSVGTPQKIQVSTLTRTRY